MVGKADGILINLTRGVRKNCDAHPTFFCSRKFEKSFDNASACDTTLGCARAQTANARTELRRR